MGVEIYYGVPGLVSGAAVFSLMCFFLLYASPSRTRLAFLALALAAFIFMMGDGLGRLSAAGGDAAAATTWGVVSFMGVVFIPVATLFLAASYPRAQPRRWLDLVLYASLAAALAFCALRVLTDLVVVSTSFTGSQMNDTFGPAFYVFALYAMALSFLSIALFERTARAAASRLTRRNARLGVAATGLPFVGAVLSMAFIGPSVSPGYDPVIPLLTVSAALYAGLLLSHEAPTSSLAAIRAIFAAMPDALVIANPAGVISYANPAAVRLLSKGAAPLEGMPAREALQAGVLLGTASDALVERFREVQTGKSEQVLFGYETPGNGARAYSAVVAATQVHSRMDGAGAASVFFVSSRFVFVLIHDETEARAREGMLTRANEVKDLFISMLGHDLKAPLGAISGYAELIALDAQTAPDALAVYRYSQQISDSARIIQLMMENARTFSKLLDPKDIMKNKEATNLKALLGREVSNLRAAAERRKVDVELKADGPDADFVVWGAPILRSVFQNLIDNAIKYTAEKSKVTVRLAMDGDFAVIAVEDQGPGIPKDKREAVFRKFSRLEQTSAKAEGLGLGLPLSKQIVELHGGTIMPGPREDGAPGAAFIVRLPKGSPPLPQP